jgi:uncharacterized repeat protein (TIGR01451 family)
VLINDNHFGWPAPNAPNSNISSLLSGVTDGGTVKPGDTVEYTIYFLSSGKTSAKNVNFCDSIPKNTTFIATTFNSWMPAGAASGIAIAQNPNVPTAYLTNAADADRGQFLRTGITPPMHCSGNNTNGAAVVALGDLLPGTYGFVRFQVKINLLFSFLENQA